MHQDFLCLHCMKSKPWLWGGQRLAASSVVRHCTDPWTNSTSVSTQISLVPAETFIFSCYGWFQIASGFCFLTSFNVITNITKNLEILLWMQQSASLESTKNTKAKEPPFLLPFFENWMTIKVQTEMEKQNLIFKGI